MTRMPDIKAPTIRWMVLATLVAFLANLALPFLAVYNVPAGQAPDAVQGTASGESAKPSSLFGGKILLCTGNGFKLVSWADLQSGTEKPKPDSNFKCPLCYLAAHHFNFAFPVIQGLLAPARAHVQDSFAAPSEAELPRLTSPRHGESRAPPYSPTA